MNKFVLQLLVHKFSLYYIVAYFMNFFPTLQIQDLISQSISTEDVLRNVQGLKTLCCGNYLPGPFFFALLFTQVKCSNLSWLKHYTPNTILRIQTNIQTNTANKDRAGCTVHHMYTNVYIWCTPRLLTLLVFIITHVTFTNLFPFTHWGSEFSQYIFSKDFFQKYISKCAALSGLVWCYFFPKIFPFEWMGREEQKNPYYTRIKLVHLVVEISLNFKMKENLWSIVVVVV